MNSGSWMSLGDSAVRVRAQGRRGVRACMCVCVSVRVPNGHGVGSACGRAGRQVSVSVCACVHACLCGRDGAL